MARKGIFFPTKDSALREDVHALGRVVGEVVRDQCGDEIFDLVEGDRVAAIGRRQGEAEDSVALVVRTQGRPAAQVRDVIRAFTAWFQVVNAAEKVHRVRRRRQYQGDEQVAQPGGLEECFAALKASGLELPAVLEMLGGVSFETVLTAHPTESTRRTLLRMQQRVARLMLEGLEPTATPAERRVTIERVRSELTTAWQTAGNSRERLTVADEREHVLFFVVEVIYEVIPAFYEEIEACLAKVYGTEPGTIELPNLLRFGSWVGGDMDGHPDVHAKTIRESCQRHHQLIVNRYFREAQALAEKLSQSESRVGCSPAVNARIEAYRNLLPSVRTTTPASHDRMPYRVLLGLIAERLRATYEGRSGQYDRVEQLDEDLQLIADSLVANMGRHAGHFYVRRMQRRVRTFGFHLVTLDVRQNAQLHREVLGAALGDPEWTRRTPAERAARLEAALEADESPGGDPGPAGKRALWVFEAIEFCRNRYGQAAVGTYVVSLAREVEDVLGVLLLARWARFADGAGQVPLDVAPLLESASALEDAGGIVARLLEVPVYRRHLASRDQRQVVMLGYSDSNKSTGIAASRWALRRAQEAMLAACGTRGVRIEVFHGRGGSISRGGGRDEALVRGLPPGVLRGRLRITEQGESIRERYGLRPIAMRTFERAVSAVTLATAGVDGGRPVQPRWREAMDIVAREASASYRAIVHEEPSFLEYFQAVTPVDVIERMQIGSRPVTRASGGGVESYRSIPWAFAWSQSRHMLPGWLGISAGLGAAVDAMGIGVLRGMYAEWPWFESLLDDVETVLARADMGVAAFYEQLARPEHARHSRLLSSEYRTTVERVLAVKEATQLLDSDPTMQRIIRLRNPYVDPLHLSQVDLLQRWREGDRHDRELLDALIASVNGIAQRLQASG